MKTLTIKLFREKSYSEKNCIWDRELKEVAFTHVANDRELSAMKYIINMINKDIDEKIYFFVDKIDIKE